MINLRNNSMAPKARPSRQIFHPKTSIVAWSKLDGCFCRCQACDKRSPNRLDSCDCNVRYKSFVSKLRLRPFRKRGVSQLFELIDWKALKWRVNETNYQKQR